MAPRRKALVTGSSSGIGEAIAKELAKLDYQLVITGRSDTELSRVASECKNLSPSGSRPLEVVADLGNELDLRRLADSTENFFQGKLSVLVNNAGTVIPGLQGQVEACYAAYKQVMAVNMDSVVWLTLRMAPLLRAWAKEDGDGETSCIVNISSGAGSRLTESPFGYSCSKACLNMFTQCMAAELALSIRVNAVTPGPTITKLTERLGLPRETFVAMSRDVTSLRRPGQPEEIAQAVLYLLDSKRASFVTGTNLMVDGGNAVTKNYILPE